MKKNLVLIDCEDWKLKEFVDGIKSKGFDIECYKDVANGVRTSKFSDLKRYFKYFSAPFKLFLHRKEYDYLIGWQQFYALNFCFWCSAFHVKKECRVIALNYTYKKKPGIIGKIYRWYMEKCICTGYIDYVHVLSPNYAKVISEEFNFPIEKIVTTPFGLYDMMPMYGECERPDRAPAGKYVLSIGRSNRDYDYLVDVWDEIDTNLVIISDTYRRTDLPENVLLINDVTGEDKYPWMNNCDSLIIPIDDVKVCSGDTVLLTAMSLAKTIFVTNPSTLSEMYVEDGVDSVYINKNLNETRNIIKKYLVDKADNKIGKTARQNFLDKYSRYAMGRNIAQFMN